jgi:hypothetical protein
MLGFAIKLSFFFSLLRISEDCIALKFIVSSLYTISLSSISTKYLFFIYLDTKLFDFILSSTELNLIPFKLKTFFLYVLLSNCLIATICENLLKSLK